MSWTEPPCCAMLRAWYCMRGLRPMSPSTRTCTDGARRVPSAPSSGSWRNRDGRRRTSSTRMVERTTERPRMKESDMGEGGSNQRDQNSEIISCRMHMGRNGLVPLSGVVEPLAILPLHHLYSMVFDGSLVYIF